MEKWIKNAAPWALSVAFAVETPEAVYTSEDFALTARATAEGWAAEGRAEGVWAKWEWKTQQTGHTLRLTCRFDRPTAVRALRPLILRARVPEDASLVWEDRHFSGFGRAGELERVQAPAAYVYRQGQGLYARSLFPLRFRERYTLEREAEGILRITQSTEPPASFVSAEFESPEILLGHGDMGALARCFYDLLPRLSRGTPQLVGYNTWDYYFTDIDEACVAENLAAIAAHPVLDAHLRYFVIDDGWQHVQGDWYPNYRFPGGLSGLARRIREAGRVPGIWTSPLHVAPLSALAQRRFTFGALNAYGDPVDDGGMYLIDPTHPDGADFIYTLFRRLREAGFACFKVDFVRGLVRCDRFYDPNAGQYDALRRLFAIIREAVGEESVVIGCSLPPEAGCDTVDSGRTGIDIHNQWSHVTWTMERYQYQYGHQGKIWNNDIDFLVVRGPETSPGDPQRNVLNSNEHNPQPSRWRSGPEFIETEAKTWAAVVLLTGGSVFLSDRLNALGERGLDLCARALENRCDTAAAPEDQFDADYPAVWRQDTPAGLRLTLINWDEAPRDFAVSLPDGRWRDIWTDAVYTAQDGVLRAALASHDCLTLIPYNGAAA